MSPQESTRWSYPGRKAESSVQLLFSIWSQWFCGCMHSCVHFKHLITVAECSSKHLHLSCLWVASFELVCEPALLWRWAQWNSVRYFYSFLNKNYLKEHFWLRVATEVCTYNFPTATSSQALIIPGPVPVTVLASLRTSCSSGLQGISQDLEKTGLFWEKLEKSTQPRRAASWLHYHKCFLCSSLHEAILSCTSSNTC